MLTAEQKAAIRKRIQAEFEPPNIRYDVESSTSLMPPSYNFRDFKPDMRSVDGNDPPGFLADSFVELPPQTLGLGETVPDKPFACLEHPGRYFDGKEAAAFAGVTTAAVYSAMRDRRAVGEKGLHFYRVSLRRTEI